MPQVVDSTNYSSRDNSYAMLRVLCRQRCGLNICHINAQSLNNKIDEFRYLFENSGVDVVCVSETWFDPDVLSSTFDLSHYNLFRCDRKSHAGGVAIYVKNGITCKKCYNSNSEEQIEHIFVEISSLGNKLLVGCVYRPNRSIKTDSFLSIIENITSKYKDIVICGDFNSNILIENILLNDMKSIGLLPINTQMPTHHTATSSTLIDIVFVGNKESILLYDQLTASCFSKHDLLFVTLDFKLLPTQSNISFYDFKNINHNVLYSELLSVDWDHIYYMPSVENQLSFLEEKLAHLFETTVPLKTIRNSHQKKPWFNDDIKRAIRHRDKTFSRWKRFKTEELHQEYCLARRSVNRKIKCAKSSYYSNVFTSAVGSAKTWKAIRSIGIRGNTVDGPTHEIDIDNLNETFTKLPNTPFTNDFYRTSQVSITRSNSFIFQCVSQREVFASCMAIKSNAVGLDKIHPRFLKSVLPVLLPFITYIFNTIITQSVFPMNWKHAKIVPIPKTNCEYRPIAILPYLSKVFEKLLHHQIYTYLRDNSLLNNMQSGFRPQHSCTTALIDVTEDIRKSIDNGHITFLVLLDHSKAFDMVDHNIMCIKLQNMFNFSRASTRLLSSYLSDRRQSVFLQNRFSRPLQVSKGVPQGSILGPLLFTMYINDLVEHLRFSKAHLYADDVQIYISTDRSNIDHCIRKLNEDLKRIHSWATGNGLCINPNKSKCMVITPRTMKLDIVPQISLSNEQLEIVTSTKNLGIIFNNTLTWSDHINSASGKIYCMLRTLWKTQYFTPLKIRQLLAKSYLIPKLLYGCEIFSNCDANSFRKLNVAYNAVVRYVFGLTRYDRISSFGKTLFGISFSDLLKIRCLTFLHKIVYTQEPTYLFERLSFTRSCRSKGIIQFRSRTLVSEWQFFIPTIRLWNSLPTTITFLSNALQFKKELFKHFT